MTLTEFLLARIAEDEADAVDLTHLGRVLSGPPYWPTDRFRAECEAKRQIVELHSADHECTAPGDGYAGVFAADGSMNACPTMVALGTIYADHPDYHPDYREEWKP